MALAHLRRAFTPPPQAWAKHDLYDTMFYLRLLVAGLMGVLYGAIGAQGLIIFLSFMGINLFLSNAWLKWQGIDEAEFEDPEKINQSPLSLEGMGPSISFFVLLWVTVFTMVHESPSA